MIVPNCHEPICSDVVPISVTTMTGQPMAEGRLSPRFLFTIVALLMMFLSELVARASLPHLQQGGGVTNLISFKGLNAFVVGFIVLSFAWAFLVGLASDSLSLTQWFQNPDFQIRAVFLTPPDIFASPFFGMSYI